MLENYCILSPYKLMLNSPAIKPLPIHPILPKVNIRTPGNTAQDHDLETIIEPHLVLIGRPLKYTIRRP